jgi:hypothetical protein
VTFDSARSPGEVILLLLRWLLLGEAVQGAEAQQQIDGVNAHYRAVLEKFSQNTQGDVRPLQFTPITKAAKPLAHRKNAIMAWWDGGSRR